MRLSLSISLPAATVISTDPSPSFTDITGLRAHYSPSRGPAAQDVSGNGYNGTAVNSPTLVATGMNSHPCWRFVAASSQYFKMPAGLSTGPTAMHLFAVIKTTTADGGAFNAGQAGTFNHHPYSDGNLYDHTGSTTRRALGAQNFTTAKIFEIISTSSEHTHKIDGTQIGTNATNTVAWPNPGVFAIGCGFSSSSTNFASYYTGDVGDVVVFSAKLSAGDATTVRARLSAWFGTA